MQNLRDNSVFTRQDGQTLAEYALIISTISIGVLVAFGLVGTAIGGKYDSILTAVADFLT